MYLLKEGSYQNGLKDGVWTTEIIEGTEASYYDYFTTPVPGERTYLKGEVID